jgi:plastocyanin
MSNTKLLLLLAGCALINLPVHAKEFEILQKDKQFSIKKLTVKVGDTVSFKNEDPFSHNVFSLSDVKTFDLGSYPQGQMKKVLMDKPGLVEVECATHPDMKVDIEVQK